MLSETEKRQVKSNRTNEKANQIKKNVKTNN